MIDSHCHLTDGKLQEQLEAVLQRAADVGVQRMITVGTSLADDQQALALCRGRPQLRCTVGIHPNYAAEAHLGQLPQVRDLALQASVVALGEMGLDYHYDFAPRALQRQFLEGQLQMAADLGKPVVIHCRQAVADCLAILKNFPAIPAVFHCFTGTAPERRQILAAGYLLGFTGVITFKNAQELRQVVQETPLERLLLETDAPYLTPEPFRRQKVNEPAMVVHTAAQIARLKGISLIDLDRATTANAEAFFRWPPD